MTMQLAGPRHFFGHMDIPRNLAAGAVGVAAGLAPNPWVPVGTLAVGLLAQMAEPHSLGLLKLQYATEGLVDASVGLIARNLTMHIMASEPAGAPDARGYTVDPYRMRGLTDADAMVG